MTKKQLRHYYIYDSLLSFLSILAAFLFEMIHTYMYEYNYK